MAKRYRIFVPERVTQTVNEMRRQATTQVVIDEDTMEQFEAQIMISEELEEGYDELIIQERGGNLMGQWYVKILKRTEEEEDITVFESMKLGERKGYMLRSMMAEEKQKEKKEAMTTELVKRWKQKRAILDKVLKKEQED